MRLHQRLAAAAIRRLGRVLRRSYPPVRALNAEHVRRCRVAADRRELLRLLPKGAACAELGIERGDFSAAILESTAPSRLHLVDLAPEYIRGAEIRFAAEIALGRVSTQTADAADALHSFPAGFFDWVYIDADHTYERVRLHLGAARHAVKKDGCIVLNDYTSFDHLGMLKYGVVEAVNEMCLDMGYEIIALALEPNMFCDVVLARTGIFPEGLL